MMRKARITLIVVSLLFASNLCVAAEGEISELSFEIKEYKVEGNTLIPPDELKSILSPYTGAGKTLDTVRQAHTALQKAYHDRGFVTVRVTLPELELENGIVRFYVLESVLGWARSKAIVSTINPAYFQLIETSDPVFGRSDCFGNRSGLC